MSQIDLLPRESGWICTASGRRIWPLAIDADQIALEDIAAALSRQCRFGGHCRTFYSVAQHSVHVAELLEDHGPETALSGLLHDAAETYLIDLPGPVKHAPEMAGYRLAEDRVSEAVAAAFELSYPASVLVKQADQTMMATEVRDLMPKVALEAIPAGLIARAARVKPWSPRRAHREFEEAFHRYVTLRRRGSGTR